MSTRRAKRPGTIEPPRDVISTKREKIFIESKGGNKTTKKVMIITTYETINTIRIYIGNRDIYCMDVQLLKDSETQTATTGHLEKARWDTVCSLDEPFGKGTDTILMIKTLINYIKNTYPNVEALTFNDMSTKTCDDGSSVSLAAMKLFTDGETWYETHFDISLDTYNKSLYETIKKTINEKKRELSFDKFSMYSNTSALSIQNGKLRIIYDESDTWQKFFSEIRNIVGISKLCVWLSKNNWFDIFLHTILKVNIASILFMLEVRPYDNIIYKLINNIGGKYRFSRKNYR